MLTAKPPECVTFELSDFRMMLISWSFLITRSFNNPSFLVSFLNFLSKQYVVMVWKAMAV